MTALSRVSGDARWRILIPAMAREVVDSAGGQALPGLRHDHLARKL